MSFDACKWEPKNPDAYKRGKEIGEQSARDGDTGAAMKKLGDLTQLLFQETQSLPPNQRRPAWAAASRDADFGMACGDQAHFADVFKPTDSDPRTRTADDAVQRHPDVSGQVNSAYAAFAQGRKMEDRIAHANAYIHNAVDALGPDGRNLFIKDFNDRREAHFQGEPPVIATLTEDGQHVILKRIPESN